MKKSIVLFLFITFYSVQILAQNMKTVEPTEEDACGYYLLTAEQKAAIKSTTNWGYSYADLLSDIDVWNEHPFVNFESIGKSVQNGDLLMLTFRNPESTNVNYRINIHARTHPNEVQGTYVTNEIINILLSGSELANRLLEHCEVTIIPMINPDGVELNYARENANDVDIESNWGNSNPEPEVVALKTQFDKFMTSELPIDVAFNMHSAYACKRFFWYHLSAGTSYQFTLQEQDFIGSIVSYFSEGMEPWDYATSWSSGTPTTYPESWFWNNYGDAVMALTYEDMNCASAGDYDKTANALMSGVADYLKLEAPSSILELTENMIKVFPNPVKQSENLKFSLNSEIERLVSVSLIGLDGKIFRQLDIPSLSSNEIFTLNTEGLSRGIYILKAITKKNIYTSKIIIE